MGKFELKFFKQAFLTNGVIALFILLFRKHISIIYSSIPEIQNGVSELLLPFSLYLVILMNRNFIGSFLRCKKKEYFKITFICGGIIFPVFTFSLNYWFIIIKNKGVMYILADFILIDSLIYLYY